MISINLSQASIQCGLEYEMVLLSTEIEPLSLMIVRDSIQAILLRASFRGLLEFSFGIG